MKRMTVAVMVGSLIIMGLMFVGAAAAGGTMKETAEFKIMVPDGWQFSDFKNGTLQTYNRSGSYMVQVKKAGMNMNEADVQRNVASMAKRYKGTGPEKVEMLGLVFYKTVFTAGSSHQSLYSALKGGAAISIAMSGKDHETDPTIQAVFKSIVIK